MNDFNLSEEELSILKKLSISNKSIYKLLSIYATLKTDGAKRLLYAMNKQLLNLADDISATTISISDDKGNKVFERFMKLSTEINSLIDIMNKTSDTILSPSEENEHSAYRSHNAKVTKQLKNKILI